MWGTAFSRHKLLWLQSAGTKPVSSHAASNKTQTVEYNAARSGAQAGWLTDRLRVFDPRQKGMEEGGSRFPTEEAPTVGACDAVRSPRFLHMHLAIWALCMAFLSCLFLAPTVAFAKDVLAFGPNVRRHWPRKEGGTDCACLKVKRSVQAALVDRCLQAWEGASVRGVRFARLASYTHRVVGTVVSRAIPVNLLGIVFLKKIETFSFISISKHHRVGR